MTMLSSTGEIRVNTITADSQSSSSVVRLANGGWIVTWTTNQGVSGSEIHQQRYAVNGLAIGGESLVNTFNNGSQNSPSVTSLNDGGWLVTWSSASQDGSGSGVYQQRYSNGGEKVGVETLVNTCIDGDQLAASVTTLASGGWIVTWRSLLQDGSQWGIYQQQYSKEGVKVGEETRVNTTTDGVQWKQSVTALAGGGWIVTWGASSQDGSGYGIYQQQYSSGGVKIGTETRVNTTTEGEQQTSSVIGLSDGGWLVTWTSGAQGSSISSIYQQRYQANGTPVGAETRVSTIPVNVDIPHSVAALTDGGWLVTYTCYADTTNDIFQQRYAASGAKVGGEIRVNSITAGNQDDPSVTALSDGGWLITWTSISTDGSGIDVHQQRFTADGHKVGPTTPTGLILAAQTISEGRSDSAIQLATKALVTDGSFTYTLLDDAGGRFALSAAGTLVVKDGIRLDYEQARSHWIKVLVKDAFGASYEQGFEIAVADVDSENLTGSAGGDVLKGGKYKDNFKGGAGNDTLWGGAGNDKLYGGTGNDRLGGGTGKDTLTGSTGRDVFVFDDRETGSSKGRADYITDFKGRSRDRIDLKLVDANTKKRGDQKFSFIGDDESFSRAGEVRFEKTKKYTYVYLNTDNDRAAEGVIKLKGSLELSKSWFVL